MTDGRVEFKADVGECSVRGERKATTLFGETTARTIHDHVHYLLLNFPQTDRPPFRHYIIIIGRSMVYNHFLYVRDTVRRTYSDPVLFLFFWPTTVFDFRT